MTTELDPARFTHETRRALDAACILADTLDPGLNMRPEPDGLVILDTHGAELAVIPLYRLATIDRQRLADYAVSALAALPPGMADQLIAEARDGRLVVDDDPASDWVHLVVGDHYLARVHRANLIDSWPPPDPDDQHPDPDPDDDDGTSRPW